MAMTLLYDLNVPWPSHDYSAVSDDDFTNLCNTIATLYSFGYTHVAVNFVANELLKFPINNPKEVNPIKIKLLRARLLKFVGLHIFTRLTLVISDPSRGQNLAKITNHFDIVAVQPTTERAFQLCAANLDVDLISFNMGSRLPFYIKHKPVGSALERGVRFEITYASVIGGAASYSAYDGNNAGAAVGRKTFFSNVMQLTRASRMRGLVLSSGAYQPLHVRNYSDILALLETLGLPHNKGKLGFTDHAENALVHGRLRIKSYKQGVVIGNEPLAGKQLLVEYSSEDPDDRTSARGYKRKREGDDKGEKISRVISH